MLKTKLHHTARSSKTTNEQRRLRNALNFWEFKKLKLILKKIACSSGMHFWFSSDFQLKASSRSNCEPNCFRCCVSDAVCVLYHFNWTIYLLCQLGSLPSSPTERHANLQAPSCETLLYFGGLPEDLHFEVSEGSTLEHRLRHRQ